MKQSSILKGQRTDAEGELRKYKTRKSQLEAIRNNLNSDFEDSARSVTNHCNNAKSDMSSGINLNGRNVALSSLFWNEEGISDSDLSQSRSYIVSVINAVQTKISDLEREIGSLNSRITAAEDKEKEEMLEKLKSMFT